jgi:hypothetical protein
MAASRAKNNSSVVLNDYDVLGVGGPRKREAQGLALTSGSTSVFLHCHPSLIPAPRQDFYAAVLKETLTWLSPIEMKNVEESVDLEKLLAEEFQKSFPRTFAALSSQASGCLQRYLREFPWQGPLLSDQFRYFSAFLKAEGAPLEMALTAQQEWIYLSLSFSDFGSQRADPGVLTVNPSLQVFPVVQPAGPFMQGLYVYYCEPASGEVKEARLGALEAEILDLLQEERKYTTAQILAHLEVSTKPPDEVSKKLSKLISQGIILDNRSSN